MHGDSSNHQPAVTAMHTGSVNFIRPSIGRLGCSTASATENTNVPGYIVLGGGQKGDYGSAFPPGLLPGHHDWRPVKLPPPDLPACPTSAKPEDEMPEAQRKQLDFVQWLNQQQLERDIH